MIKDIVVVGGGFAGYITALIVEDYFCRIWPDSSITVIESSKIGTIGVGETTSQQVPLVLAKLGISPLQFLKETNGTFKLGVKFKNWNYSDEEYYHILYSLSQIDRSSYTSDKNKISSVLETDKLSFDLLYMLANELPLESIGFSNMMDNNSLPFKWDSSRNAYDSYQLKDYNLKKFTENQYDLEHNFASSLGFHMDANLSITFLQKICKERNIKIIEGKVESWKQDKKTENLTELKLDTGRKIKGDFFFDCTGFRRLILGSIFKEEWVDYSKHIPQNSVSLLEGQGIHNKSTKTYTNLVAQKNGWQFEIPLQNRTGTGYVFSDKLVDEEDVKKEQIEYWKKLGHEAIPSKILKWNPGKFKRSYVKNCLAVGLSDGFIEPLDGNALILSLNLLTDFLPKLHKHMVFESYDQDLINKHALEAYDHTRNYIYWCHLQKRNDSKYWNYFKQKQNMPKMIQDGLNAWDSKPLMIHEFHTTGPKPFGLFSWYTIGQRSGLLNKLTAKRFINDYGVEQACKTKYDLIIDNMKIINEKHINQDDILKWINKTF